MSPITQCLLKISRRNPYQVLANSQTVIKHQVKIIGLVKLQLLMQPLFFFLRCCVFTPAPLGLPFCPWRVSAFWLFIIFPDKWQTWCALLGCFPFQCMTPLRASPWHPSLQCKFETCFQLITAFTWSHSFYFCNKCKCNSYKRVLRPFFLLCSLTLAACIFTLFIFIQPSMKSHE